MSGSRAFHADTNCDGVVNAFDIDPFVLRLTAGEPPTTYCALYCSEEDCACASLDGLGGGAGFAAEGAGTSAGELAGMFAVYVAAERLPVIIDAAEQVAAHLGDTPRGDFWRAVLAELE